MAETVGDTTFAVLNRLAGEGNNLKVDFDSLVIGAGPLQAKISGALVLDVVLPK